MSSSDDDEVRASEATRPNVPLILLIVLNLMTWTFLGYALLTALVVGRSPYDYYTGRRAVATPAPVTVVANLPSLAAGNLPELERLLEQGEDPDQLDDTGRSALFYAAQAHQLEAVKLLLEHSADADQIMAGGERPLLAALEVPGDAVTVRKIVELLLDYGADVNEADTAMRSSPLHWAVTHRYSAIVQELLRRGADPDAVDVARNTPLHLAVQQADHESAAALLEAGAKPDILNNLGQTPRQVSQSVHDIKPLFDELVTPTAAPAGPVEKQ